MFQILPSLNNWKNIFNRVLTTLNFLYILWCTWETIRFHETGLWRTAEGAAKPTTYGLSCPIHILKKKEDKPRKWTDILSIHKGYSFYYNKAFWKMLSKDFLKKNIEKGMKWTWIRVLTICNLLCSPWYASLIRFHEKGVTKSLNGAAKSTVYGLPWPIHVQEKTEQ